MVSKTILHRVFSISACLNSCVAHVGHGRGRAPMPGLAHQLASADFSPPGVIPGAPRCVCAGIEVVPTTEGSDACVALFAFSLKLLPRRKHHFSRKQACPASSVWFQPSSSGPLAGPNPGTRKIPRQLADVGPESTNRGPNSTDVGLGSANAGQC